MWACTAWLLLDHLRDNVSKHLHAASQLLLSHMAVVAYCVHRRGKLDAEHLTSCYECVHGAVVSERADQNVMKCVQHSVADAPWRHPKIMTVVSLCHALALLIQQVPFRLLHHTSSCCPVACLMSTDGWSAVNVHSIRDV
jgi:hypothetical protein